MEPSTKSTTLCKYFLHGACTFGSDCAFAHSLQAPSNSVCTHWLNGYCSFGDKCRYEHKHPEWAPREDRGKGAKYTPPTEVAKPAVDRIEKVAPISQLRLGGQAAHLTAGGPAARGAAAERAALAALQAEERRSPPPVNLPADPFGAGEGAPGDHADALAALSLGGDDDAVEEEAPQHAAPQGQQRPPPDAHAAATEHWRHEQARREGAQHFHPPGYGGEGYHGEYAGGEGDEAAAGEHGYYAEGGGGGGYGQDGGEYGHSHSGYGSYVDHDGHAYLHGEAGSEGAYGTSPSHLPAWHIPGAGDDGEWGPGADPSRFYATPALRSLCYDHFGTGACHNGAACQMVHGDYCETCQHYALHPHDPAARAAHLEECAARHARLAARERSAHVECAICMERVMEKAYPGDRKFGLLACEHPFCLRCIREWRQHVAGGADLESALRTCPLCRLPSHFVTPSTVWPASPEEKEAVVGGYRAKLASIDCRHFAWGEGACPFGISCLYRHAYPDGRIEEKALRRVAADEGEVRVVQPVRLSDFIVIQQGRVRGRRGGR